MTDDQPIRILFVEDVPQDAELAEHALRREGLNFIAQRVETAAEFLAALAAFNPDLIISDYTLPAFDGMQALRLSLEADAARPFIVLTGSLNEETAVACIKAGATDYVLKDRIVRLPFAVKEALEQKHTRQAKEAAERALRASEERYRAIFERAPVGFFQSTPAGRYFSVNPAMARLLGYDSPDDVLSTVTDITAQIYVDPARRAEFQQLLAEHGEVLEFINQNRRKDGSIIYTSSNARAVCDEHGQVQYYEGFMTDITARVQAEEALRESMRHERERAAELQIIMDVVPASILIAHDQLCRLVTGNRTAYLSRGRPPGSNLSASVPDAPAASRVQVRRNGADVPPSDWPLQLTAATGVEIHDMECEVIHADGRVTYELANVAPILDEAGRPRGAVGAFIDITERKQAEAALRESEQRFAAAFQTSPDSININRLNDGVYIEVNSGFCDLTGYTRSEVIGRSSLDLNIWADPADRARLVQGLAAQGQVIGLEAPFRMKDGTLRTGLMSARLIDIGGEKCILSITRDISERKKMENALRESELFARSTVDALAAQLCILDETGQIVAVNRAWRDFAAANAVDPASVCEGADYLAVCDRAAAREPDAAAMTAGIRAVIRGEQSQYQLEYSCHAPNERLWFVARVTRFDGNGPNRVVVAHENITALRRREHELEAVALTATALRAATTRADMIPVIVHQAFNLLQADSTTVYLVDPATGETFVAFGQGDSADWGGIRFPPGAGIVGHVISSGRPYLNNEVHRDPRLYRPDLVGDRHAMACVPLIAQNQVIGALAIGRRTDIVEEELRLLAAIGDIAANALQRAEVLESLEQRVVDRTRELAIANERLTELDRLKSKFVADVSHELRTPITSLSLYVDLLERGNPDKREIYITRLKQQVARLRTMIEEILDLARLEREQSATSLMPLDLNTIVEHTVATQQPVAEAAGLTLTGEISEPAPLVMARPDQLSRAVANLVTNAIKYTRPGGTIVVASQIAAGRACISVTDTGIGIAPEDLPHLFERFYRGRQVAQLDIPGVGLGLSIVKEIIEAHGGTVEVETQLGAGTTFRLCLPLADAANL